MRMLITGAAGMLGRDVTRAAQRAGHEVVALARADLDVADWTAVRRCMERARPAAVVNCAGWTDVDGAEADPRGAEAVNGEGASHVAHAARLVDAAIVHVSTDYVFDGTSPVPYVESDPPAPRTAYGRSKLMGEEEVAAENPRSVIVRSSWLFGVGGRNFADTMLRLAAERDEVAVVDDQVGCPTWTGHLAGALVELAGAPAHAHGIHHIAGRGSCSWHDFACEIFRQAAVDCRVVPTTTTALGRPAPRPAQSALASERADAIALPPWQEGLAGYLAERAALRAAA